MTADFVTALLVNSAVFSALFLAMLLVRRLFKARLSAFLRYALWAAVVVKLLLPFGFESPIGPVSWLPPAQARVETTNEPASGSIAPGIMPAAQPQDAAAPVSSMLPGASGNALAKGSAPQPAQPGSVPPPLRWTDWGMLLWASGAAPAAGWLLLCLARLMRRVRQGSAAVPARVMATLDGCRRELGIRRRVAVRMGPAFGVPGIAGLFRPVLLLPEDSAGRGEPELRHVMLHELSHLKHGDLAAIQLMNLLSVLYWFNPLVWLCFRMARRDMETLCDQRALRQLGREQRVGYVETVLRYSGLPCGGRLHAALRMGSGRAGMERRVREMLRRSSTGKSARLAAALVAALMLASGLLTACQPSPTKAAVANKGGDQLEERLKATATPGSQTGPGAQARSPGRYADSFTGADAGVTVNIDAAVTAPEGAMPVVEVKPRNIPVEQVKAMASVLFRGATAYEPQIGFTKADIQRKILDLQKLIADDKSLLDSYNGNRKSADKAKAGYEWQIDEYEKQLPGAPETAARRETDWVFHPESYYMDLIEAGSGMETYDLQSVAKYYDADTLALSATVEGFRAFIQVSNFETSTDAGHLAQFGMGSNPAGSYAAFWNPKDSKQTAMTRDQAVAMVQDSLERMGIANMRLCECRAYGKPEAYPVPTSQAEALDMAAGAGVDAPQATEPPDGEAYSYSMTFVPSFEGVPMLLTSQYIENDTDPYGPTYSYERLYVNVDNGMITYLDWGSPLEQVRVENGNAAVLSLEEALDIFKQQAQREYTLAHVTDIAAQYGDLTQANVSVESGEVDVTNIQLGLMRMRIKDRPGAYRMVPAWMFSGTERFRVKGRETPVEGFQARNGLYTFAVVNAVDGSIIDPRLGY